MQFELTEELVDQIMFAIEDQNGEYLVDTQEGFVATLDELGDVLNEDTEGRYCDLPDWNSANGFQLMDRFAAHMRNLETREALRQALSSGKGVFRKFKDALKSHPEIEEHWFVFKDREMRRYILNWYNGLREEWGLEAIGGEPEDSESLLYDDFGIRPYNAASDYFEIEALNRELCGEFDSALPGEQGAAAADLWRHIAGYGGADALLTLTAYNAAEEFAGYISAVPSPADAVSTAAITGFVVKRAYRGLGIGKELMGKCLEALRERNIRWVFLVNPFTPKTLTHFLLRCGFEKKNFAFVLDLIKDKTKSEKNNN
ncbi:MAG: GNAT family N-acetyltransferase [Treponema sp.]|jgi:ribosomal protein S18 acetylase RimI-like enzyme|nr:GNAT family N-acetyltransferase [Treponema sp.]